MNEETFTTLKAGDIAAVALYFILVLGVGFVSLFRTNRGTIHGYFLAGRLMTWLPVGASLFASNIGSEHFIGLAGSGAISGIAVGAFEINACILIQFLGWVFLPVFIASEVNTLPEYMNRRFGGRRIRTYLASLSMMLYIFTKVSVNLYAGAIFIEQSLRWNLYAAILFILFMTCLCTVTGGLVAVIYTDTLQTVVMLVGSIMLTVVAFNKVGGYNGLRQRYSLAIPYSTYSFIDFIRNNSFISNVTIPSNWSYHQNPAKELSNIRSFLSQYTTPQSYISNTTKFNDSFILQAKYALCGLPDSKAWQMLRSPMDHNMPWPGFILGQTMASIWYWCADQMMVQRALAAKNLSHAQGGTLFAGYLKMLPLFIIIFPGMISRILYPDKIACATPEACKKICGNPTGCSNLAYPTLVLNILPVGAKGLMLAVMLSALMSDLTSIFNSASTLFTIDIWKIIRPMSTVKELLIVGRLFVILMTVIGIIWIPVIQIMQGGQLYIYIQSIAAYLSPPIACVYILAVLWPRCNEKGAFWSLMVGMVVGVIRMILDFVYKEPYCGQVDNRPIILSRLHYMYFAILLFWLTALVCIVVSYMTSPLPAKYMVRTTYWTRFSKDPRIDDDSTPVQTNDIVENSDLKPDIKLSTLSDVSKQTNGQTNIESDKNNLNGNVTNDSMKSPIKNNRAADLPLAEVGSKKGILDFDDQENVNLKDETRTKSAWNWFLGYSASEEQSEADKIIYVQHLAHVTSLYQGPKSKIVLNFNLIFIITVALFMYIYFTIH
ncbi:sodium/myo-inositol cotransporter-like isoform X2 [Gordionus sp. m RMFG-2023]|uniref:sodium/myo-inositol cotransporter-like isoform X2 n=1 Tax=Gordionus sp. m RMFG-2023 TaxID=3053472 RepID=UPI0031FC96A8